MRLTIRTAAVQIPVFLCLLLLYGCDGGGSPTEPRTGVFFTPDRAAGSNSVALRLSSSTASDLLSLDIYATDVSDLHAMIVTVSFPGDVLDFDGYRQGDFLEPSVPVTVSFFNNVLVTQIRVLPTGVSGSGTLVTLVFTSIRNGSGRVDFVDPQALDSAGMEMTGVDWIGGRVEVAF